MKNENAFNDWIEKEGLEEIARRLKVGRTAIINWQSGTSDPRIVVMREIRRLSKNALSYEDIIDRKILPRKRIYANKNHIKG